MKNQKKIKRKMHYIIFTCIISLLIISNIFFIVLYKKETKEEKIIEEVLFTKTEDPFNKEEKYYATINFKTFTKLYKSSDISTIAIIDNTSRTRTKFIEMINKMSFYNHTKIYLLELSKISKKNEIAFYDYDERLKNLGSNYLLTVSNNKIISITTFSNEDINVIIEGIGE